MKKALLSLILTCSSVSAIFAQAGSLDNSFGNGGLVSHSIDFMDAVNDIAIQSDGKILAAGYSTDPNTDLQTVSLVRFLGNGSPDSGFGNNSLASLSVPGFNCLATAVEIQSDGKIVLGGHSTDTVLTTPANGSFLIIRFNADGSLDSSFAADGIYSYQSASTNSHEVYSTDLKIQPYGKIILSGFDFQSNSVTNYVFIRLNSSGLPDPGFGTQGLSILNPMLNLSVPAAFALQSDGTVVFAGSIDQQVNNKPFIGALKPDGSVDSTFGTNGFTLPLYSASSGFVGITIDGNDNIFACGIDNYGSLIAKFNQNGISSHSFGTNGSFIQFLDPLENGENLEDIAIQPDGKIVAAGFADEEFSLLRLLDSGVPDSSFGTNGIVMTNFPSGLMADAKAVKLQSDGKIVLGGKNMTMTPNSALEFALARYLNSGVSALNQTEKSDHFRIFPNPASDYININIQDSGLCDYRITNTLGQELSLGKTNGYIDVSQLQNGLYFLNISISGTKSVFSFRIDR